MTFLPEEFTCTKERTCCFFPSYNGAPLVIELREVAIGLDNIGKMLAEKSFGCRTNAKLFRKRFASAECYPCNFGSKAFDVVFFLLEKRFGNEERHINVLYAVFLELCVKNLLNVFPDSIAIGANYHTSFYAGIVYKVCFLTDIRVPFGKVFIHRSNVTDKFLIVFHERDILSVFFISFDLL